MLAHQADQRRYLESGQDLGDTGFSIGRSRWEARSRCQHDLGVLIRRAQVGETIHKQFRAGNDETSSVSATEIVRRAERCIGLAVRKGQAEGTISTVGDHRSAKARENIQLMKPAGSFFNDSYEQRDAYAMAAGVSDETSEQGAMVEGELPFGRHTAFQLMTVAGNGVLSNDAHGRHLPSSWRTLYELSRLPDDEIEARS